MDEREDLMAAHTTGRYDIYIGYGSAKNGAMDGASGSEIKPPSPGVVAKQDPEHTERDFLADLGKATQRLAP